MRSSSLMMNENGVEVMNRTSPQALEEASIDFNKKYDSHRCWRQRLKIKYDKNPRSRFCHQHVISTKLKIEPSVFKNVIERFLHQD